MRIERWARLVAINVRRARRTFLLSVFGIAVGISSLAFFTALSGGVRKVVLGQIFRVDRVEVEPAKSSFDLGLGLLGPAPISDETVGKLRAIPGVAAAAPRMRIAFPAKAWGGAQIIGRDRFAELIGEGLDPAAVAGQGFGPLPFADLEEGVAKQCGVDTDCPEPHAYCASDVRRCMRPVPMLISRVLVELYNNGFAPAHGLPRIGKLLASRFKGFTFTVELGASFLGKPAARGAPRQRRFMLVGISDQAVPIGVSVPLAYVRRWNAEYAGSDAGYSSVTLSVGDRGAVTEVAARARALGLSIVDSGAERAGVAIVLLTALFWLVSLAILVVASINIAHTFFRAVVERRRELGVLRAVGASAADVRALLLGEAAAIGLTGGIAGVASAALLTLAVDVAARRLLPDFPFKPQTFFAWTPGLVLGVVAFGVVACVLGALLPARAAGRLEPAEALASA